MTAAAWPEVALGDVCTFKYGKSLPAGSRSGEGLPVYGSNGVVGHHTASLTNGPTIVVGRKGSAGELQYSSGACWPIDTTYYVDYEATTADLRWLYYRMQTLGLDELNRAAAVPGLNREDAYRQSLLLPPIEEQRRIAAVLDKADELRAKRRAALALLDTLTESIFMEMFGAEYVDAGRATEVELNDIVDQTRPIRYGILKPGPDIEGGQPYIRVVDMKDGGIDHQTVRRTTNEIAHQYRRSTLQRGDLLMSIRGHVGRLAEVPAELDGANITQDSARIAVVDAEAGFVLEQLRLSRTQDWMDRNTKGAAVRGINIGDVRRIPIILPERSRQREFVEKARGVSAARSSALHQTSTADELFAALQQRAFRGEL